MNRNSKLYNEQVSIFLEAMSVYKKGSSYQAQKQLEEALIDLNVMARRCGVSTVREDLEYNVQALQNVNVIYISFAKE